jgi:hypothetical protein
MRLIPVRCSRTSWEAHHPGDQGDFFAAEPGDAASAAEVGQADLLRGEPGPSCGQELPDVVRSVHATESTSATAS